MKLKRLVVGKYKNLQSLQIDFSPGEGLSILVGNNGSGKSNILEVISGIFHDLFQAKNKRKISCDYSLEYVLNDVNCKLEQKNGNLRCYAPKRIARNRFVSTHAPNNVIGLYSGEENRLWTSFYEVYYKTYMRRIFAHEPQARMRLVFVNKYYWNVALLTLLLSDNDTLKPFVEKDLGIKEVSTIELAFDFKHFHEANDLLQSFVNRINPKHEPKQRLSLADFKMRITRETHRDELGKAIVGHVDVNDLETFRLLSQAYMPKYKKIITKIAITVNDGVTVEQLSEGEKKLILVKTVLEILSDERTLVLLDEPDAHLHELRKEQLYSILSEYENRQFVIASHSPILIDIAREEQVVMLKVDKSGNARIYATKKMAAIRELTGRRMNVFVDKPLLYCEGAETSIEATLYPVLFPNYHVIPVGGHEEVVNLTKTYNKTFKDKNHYAIGIIDWDYRTEDQLSELKKQHIYSLNVVEVENVLMDLSLLTAARDDFCSEESCLEEVQQTLFADCEARKEYQAAKYTANNMVSKIRSGISPDSGAIEKFKARIRDVCDMNKIDGMYTERLKCLDDYLSKKNFAEITKIYDFGHNIDRFVTALVNNYQNRILMLIRKRIDLQQFLRTKYYSEVK